MSKYDLNLRDYWRILRRRKNIVILSILLLGSFSTSLATIHKPPPLYEAMASVKVEQVSTLTGLYLETISWNSADPLETQAAIIRSYPILEKVSQRLHLIPEGLTTQEIQQNQEYLKVVLSLKDQITTEKLGFTNIINITATAPEPKYAQQLANIIAQVYREENIREKNKRTRDARLFIESQLRVLEKKLEESQERVRTFRETNKLISLDSQSDVALKHLAEAESQYNVLNKSREELALILKQLRNGQGIPEKTMEGLFTDQTSPIFSKLNSHLVDLRLRRDTLLLDYQPNHPEVQEVNSQIDEVTKNMIQDISSQEKAIQRQEEALKKEIERFKGDVTALPEKGLTLARLEQEVKMNQEIYTLLKTKHQEALIKEAEQVEEVTIIKPSLEPKAPTNPPKIMTTGLIGTIMGIILGLALAFVVETMDTSIGAIEDVESLLGVPVVGVIPHVDLDEMREMIRTRYRQAEDEETSRRWMRLATHFIPHSMLAESYRTLRTNIQFINFERSVKIISFTSSSPLEGKTTIVSNLAIAASQAGKKTLLIESDLRKPSISRILGLERFPGLTDILLGNYEWREVVRNTADLIMGKMGMEEVLFTPGLDNLSIITSGHIPPNPSELLSSSRMAEFISQVSREYDLVLLDSSPILSSADAAVLGSKIDGVVMVYLVGKIARGALKRAKVQLEQVNAKVLGVVLNGLRPEISPDFKDLRYDYEYAYGAGDNNENNSRRWSAVLQYIKSRKKMPAQVTS